MAYFKLLCNTPEDDDGGFADIVDHFVEGANSWISGERFNATISTPLEFDVEPEEDYQGLPAEMFFGETFLMTTRLVDALKEAGVDNIDCYPATLTHIETGEKYDYQAVNIIGTRMAADLEKSDWESFDGDARTDTFFNKLVVDEEKVGGLLLFRLAESLSTVIVHEKVKDHLLASGIDTLTFLELQPS